MRQEVAAAAPKAEAYLTLTERVAALTLTERVAAARAALAENSERLAAAAEWLSATGYSLANGRSQREQLHESAYARLPAKPETMPVIEQAEGILIAQTGCIPEEAFDMLRRVSQRSNVRVSELAAGIVDRAVTRGGQAGNTSRTRRTRSA